MGSLNKVQLIGRLGRDPEQRMTNTGKAVCSFSIATDNGYGDKKTTEWHNVSCWEKTAEACAKYLRKGSQVYVEGRLQSREYQGKDGTKKKAVDVVAERVVFLETKGEGGGKRLDNLPEQTEDKTQGAPLSDDDIPF